MCIVCAIRNTGLTTLNAAYGMWYHIRATARELPLKYCTARKGSKIVDLLYHEGGVSCNVWLVASVHV